MQNEVRIGESKNSEVRMGGIRMDEGEWTRENGQGRMDE